MSRGNGNVGFSSGEDSASFPFPMAMDMEVKLQLPQSLPQTSYDTSHQGEVTLTDALITDHTLADELSIDLNEQVATSYKVLVVAIPVVLGTTKEHGILPLHVFTNSTKKVLSAYGTNYNYISQLNDFEEGDDGTVRILLGDDVITYQVQDEVKCKGENKVGKDFNEVLGKIITVTNYPLPLDWGCELLGSQISFCQVLNEVQCGLAAVGGDVCILTSTSSSERCPSTMKILNSTGVFQQMIPFLEETVPNESFEAEFIDREHTTGIKYPCLTH
ncbi:hypothetical protein HOLleu_13731 [Holothuria leucospilota]|uniref:Uncharacterized protein n=1 Tax=Holothuria leucospilota TaxID=206669 RepID=A0A9Q1HB68_HOLLE|nr:hypothetical protein HOLleu_13731 [Holothuria leucospilota]